MISIVVPAYNAAGVIGRCIDTVLRQTYPDFELLIIDDGSTDETAEIAAAKAAQDARIHLIRQENAGVSSARNTGIAAASGELLCFIDCDDTVSANYLETLLALYSPGVLPVIDVVRSDRDGSALSPMPETITLDGDWVDSYFAGSSDMELLFPFGTSCFLYRRFAESTSHFCRSCLSARICCLFSSICNIASQFALARMPVTIIPLYWDRPCYPQGITHSHTKRPSGSCQKRDGFPCQLPTGHCPDGRLTRVLSLLPIRLSSTEAIRNSKSGGVNFVRRHYTVPPLLRKSHPVTNGEFCILLCTLRTRLQYMCFSDC